MYVYLNLTENLTLDIVLEKLTISFKVENFFSFNAKSCFTRDVSSKFFWALAVLGILNPGKLDTIPIIFINVNKHIEPRRTLILIYGIIICLKKVTLVWMFLFLLKHCFCLLDSSKMINKKCACSTYLLVSNEGTN